MLRVLQKLIFRYNKGMAIRQKEGRKLRLDPFSAIIPYIMVERADAQNHIEISFETANAEAMIRELRHEGYDSIGMLHIIIASYVRTVSQRPAVNRFIRGQKIYARNDIVINLAVKKKMSLDGIETTVKMHFRPEHTIFDVYEIVNEALKEVYEEKGTSVDRVANVINYIPGLIKKGVIALLKTMDYFGLIPGFLLEASPFHGSLFITNMASLNIPPIKHHLYNFGNVPLFIAFGAKRGDLFLDEDGTVRKRRVIDMILNMDERICDGYYYASAMKMLKRYLSNPEELREPPKEIVIDK